MKERDIILNCRKPITRESLSDDLKILGLKQGDVIIAHALMSKLGWVVGRKVSIVDAILGVLGQNGTFIMPSQSGDNTDPSYWQNTPIPKDWIETLKEHMPVFNPKRTLTRNMGKVADSLLMHPNCIRSNHPQVSFCGVGKKAIEILEHHQLHLD